MAFRFSVACCWKWTNGSNEFYMEYEHLKIAWKTTIPSLRRTTIGSIHELDFQLAIILCGTKIWTFSFPHFASVCRTRHFHQSQHSDWPFINHHIIHFRWCSTMHHPDPTPATRLTQFQSFQLAQYVSRSTPIHNKFIHCRQMNRQIRSADQLFTSIYPIHSGRRHRNCRHNRRRCRPISDDIIYTKPAIWN